MNLISHQDLSSQLGSDTPPLLLDVMSDQHFEKIHIKGAENACIYEVIFLDRVAELAKDKDQEIVVYGLSGEFQAAKQACQALTEAGYSRVKALEGGLRAWQAQALAVVEQKDSAADASGEWNWNLEESIIRWTGRNLVNQHSGTLKVESGKAQFENGHLKSAVVVVNFDSLECSDIPPGKMNEALIGHLKSNDFFGTAEHPRATFRFEQAEEISQATPGRPNLKVSGSLELRGVKNDIEFEAILNDVDGRWVIQANLDLDRTRWGSVYGSGRFFEALAKHLVNDHVSIQVQLFSQSEKSDS